jgi:hypothetical protein
MSRVLDPEGAHLAALRRLGSFRGQKVLELGCGDGKHYPNGTALVDAFEGKARRMPEEALLRLNAIRQSLVVREHCRLRRLVVASDFATA